MPRGGEVSGKVFIILKKVPKKIDLAFPATDIVM